MGYSSSAIRGVSWNGVLKVVSTVIAAGKIFVLARLLTPSDFGLASLAFIVFGLTEAFTETGINTIIVQSKKGLSYFLDTAWVISIIRGLVISVVMLLVSMPLARFFHEDQLLFLVALVSLVPLIRGFINPAVIGFQKDLLFFNDTIYRFLLVLVDAVVAIALALVFHSVFIFVLTLIATAVFEVVMSFVILRQRPKFQYLPSRAQEIFGQMRSLNVSNILGYLIQNVDNFLIGKILGTTTLGIYTNGYALSQRLNLELSKSVQHGTFPVYVRIEHEQARLRRAFLKTVILAMSGFVFVGLPFMFFPTFFVKLLLGSQWTGVIAILPLLILAGLIQSLFTITMPLLIVKKAYHWLNLGLAVNAFLMITGIGVLGTQFGLLGAVWGVLLARLIALPFALLGAKKVLYD